MREVHYKQLSKVGVNMKGWKEERMDRKNREGGGHVAELCLVCALMQAK